jgi:hypothetical protein
VAAYLNTPPLTKAKKVNAMAESNPATISLLSATPRQQRVGDIDSAVLNGAWMMEKNGL